MTMAYNNHTLGLVFALMVVMLFARCDAEHRQNAMDATIGNTGQHHNLEVKYKIMSILRAYVSEWAPHYLPSLNSTVGTSCPNALEDFYNSEDLWSGLMIDSWGKFPDGLITRSQIVLGMYDECLIANNKTLNIKGRYCLVTVMNPRHPHSEPGMFIKGNIIDKILRIGELDTTTPGNRYLQYGTCMPHACTQQQLKSSLSELHDDDGKEVSVHCSKDSIILDGVDISFIVFCSVFLLLMLSGAALDYYIELTNNHQLGKGPLRFLLPFSVTTNLKKLFAINTKPNPNTISCLNAMRVMSMCWVVMGHEYSKVYEKVYDRLQLYNKIDSLLFQTIWNADVSVDSFFFLSGLLVTYGVLREIKKSGKLNIIMFYVHRILRLTPPIAMCVWFFSSVNRHLVSGPSAYGAEQLADRCRLSGWRDIMYLSNIYWDNYKAVGCLGQCWYTAVDTQLYLIAPLLILPLHYFKDFGQGWLYVMTIISLIIPGFITHRSMNADFAIGSQVDWDPNGTYTTPWCRAGSWIVGIWTGYIIFKTGNQLKLKKWQVVVGWTCAWATAFMVLYGIYNVDVKEAATTYIIYNALMRPAWAACLAWVVIACHNGYGGIVNNFMSHPVWQPVSRLTYGLYLVAYDIQDDLVIYSRKNLFSFTHINVIIETAGALFVSGIGAVLLSLVAEAPILGLEKLIFNRPGHGPEKTEVKKPEEPALANDNGIFVNDENELKQLSETYENDKTEENNVPYTQADIKE